MRQQPIPILIDTDPGVDDALALLLAFRSPEVRVVGITTVCGNVSVEQATRNLHRLISLFPPPTPCLLGVGADRPLGHPLQTATYVHGQDGLGDLDRFREPNGAARYPVLQHPPPLPSAWEVWARCLEQYSDNLTLVTLGPMTNLARALDQGTVPVDRFQRVIAMLGAIAVPGNVTPAAEFNAWVDPHAVQRVLAADLPLTLVPLDVTTQVAWSRQRLREVTDASRDPMARFVWDATQRVLEFTERVEGIACLHLHDPLAVAAVIDETLLALEHMHVVVETDGTVSRGLTLADRRHLTTGYQALPNVHVACRVDASRALRLVEERLCPR